MGSVDDVDEGFTAGNKIAIGEVHGELATPAVASSTDGEGRLFAEGLEIGLHGGHDDAHAVAVEEGDERGKCCGGVVSKLSKLELANSRQKKYIAHIRSDELSVETFRVGHLRHSLQQG